MRAIDKLQPYAMLTAGLLKNVKRIAGLPVNNVSMHPLIQYAGVFIRSAEKLIRGRVVVQEEMDMGGAW